MSASATELGRVLVEGRRRIDMAESEWLTQLAEFDTAGLWAGDGHVGCGGWLVANCGLGRSTAFEKLRVAHELQRRPRVSDAYARGEISYSQVRAITSVTDGGGEFDEIMLAAAPKLTTDELQRAAQHWQYLRNQDEPPPDLDKFRRIRRTRGFGGGLGRLIIDDRDENIDRFLNVLDGHIEAEDEAPAADAAPAYAESAAQPEPESAAQTDTGSAAQTGDSPGRPAWSMRRVDALNDLIEIAAVVDPRGIDVERAAIGVTVAYESLASASGSATLSSGRVITGEAARRLCCDAGVHRIVTRGTSEILDVGRKTREWSTPQRRAIKARHGHKCAIKGCGRRIVEIHHVVFWENGGLTCVENGVPVCLSHHHMVHEGGWHIAYNPSTGTTTLTAPNRTRTYNSQHAFADLPLAVA